MRFLVVLAVLLLVSSVCAGPQAKSCSVVPKDQYVEYGRDTEAVCQSSCVSGGVVWTLNDRPVDPSLSRSVNSSHAVLTLRNLTHRHAVLRCHSSHTNKILGGAYIRTYKKPANLSCVIHHETQHEMGVPQLLTCRWEHQDAPSHIKYTLLYARRSNPENEDICRSPVTSCTCRGKVRVTADVWLTVRATADRWEVDSDRFIFKPYEIMRITRPSVKVTASADQVEVKWSRPVPSLMGHCQVRYAKDVNGEFLEPKVLNKTLQRTQQTGTETLKVDPCTNYTISVRCALDRAPWSEWSQEETLLTGLSKRHVRLRLWRTISDPGGSEPRKVVAMWTEIPPTCPGTFTYALTKTRCRGDAAGADRTPVRCGRSPCGLDVDEHAHRLHLAVLENGTLLAEDSVYVPASAETDLPRVTDIQTSSLGGVVLVQWKAPAQPVSGYVVDWTHRGHWFYWKESGCTNTTLSGLLNKKPYDITVTPLLDNRTGRGTQALQICSTVGDPGNVTDITVKPNDRSAFVGWRTTSQEECSGDVVSYTVHYGAETGPTLNVTVDGSRQSVDLKELEPDTQYSVYVEASALTGSTRSSRRLFKTKRYDPRLPLALGVCGSIVIALVFSVGLFCAVRWKRFSEKPVPNPGLSSLKLWSSAGQKGVGSFQPFITPSESLVDHIYTEGPQRTTTSPLATSCNTNPASDKADEYADPAVAPDVQGERSPGRVLCSSGESAALLPSGSSPVSPYRSQSSVEAFPSMTVKQCKRVPAKPLAPVTVYVTLDMCDQGQSR